MMMTPMVTVIIMRPLMDTERGRGREVEGTAPPAPDTAWACLGLAGV